MYKDFFTSFHIGAYCLNKNSRDEEHVRELAECGIDLLFCVNNDTALLDLLAKYNVKAIVNGVLPGWFGADGKNAGTMHLTNPKEAYLASASLFKDHRAIIGIDVGDEPSALDFPHYGRVIELMKDVFPDKLLYLNIYPSYGMLADAGKEQAQQELGTDTYAEYLTAYAECVDLPYVSIDHYLYSSEMSAFLGDLATASSVAKKYNRALMMVLQVNSKDEGIYISEDELRLQAWCSLAYGARTVTWACYSPGWWHNCVLDDGGAKTEQYEKLKAVNKELRDFAELYMRYSHRNTTVVKGGASYTAEGGVTVSVDSDTLLGEFRGESGETALLCVPLDRAGEVKIDCDGCEKIHVLCHTPKETFIHNAQNHSVLPKGTPIFIYNV